MHHIRIFLGSLIVGALTLTAGTAYWVYSLRPQRSGVQSLSHLRAEVTVRFDAWGIPHIRAVDETDALRALGYVHAQDRLFQIDFMRRMAQGRLAEIVGEAAISSDKLFRLLGIRDAARRYGAQIESERTPTQAAVLAYLDGINQFIAKKRWPLEYALLNAEPKRFAAADIASIYGLLAYGFAQGFQEDPLITNIAQRYGTAYLQDLARNPAPMPALSVKASLLPPTPAPLQPPEEQPASTQAALAFAHTVAQLNAQISPPQLQGSNAWAISGRHTKNGKPILANDPHTSFTVPSIWYEAQLNSPTWKFYGHFLPGLPFPLMLHNQKLATGITLWENDEVDFFSLRLHPRLPNVIRERGKWVTLGYREERILVKDRPPVTFRVSVSRHGPLINALYPTIGGAPIAVSWNYLNPYNQPLHAFYAISHAHNLATMHQAAALHWSPGMNLLYADNQNNIAMWAIGRPVVRPLHVDSHRILDGSSNRDEWLGNAPFSANPRYINPPSGMVYSANQPYPSHNPFAESGPIAGYYPAPDRAQQLLKRLNNNRKRWTLSDFSSIQTDIQNPAAASLCRRWLAEIEPDPLSPVSRAAASYLKIWEGKFTLSSVGATLCQRWRALLTEKLFREPLGDKQWEIAKQLFLIDRSLPLITAKPRSPWWGKAPQARRRLLKQTYQATLHSLQIQLGDEVQKWKWERVHTLTQLNPLSSLPLLGPLFTVGPFPLEGGRDALNNQYEVLSRNEARINVGPTTRRLIDLANPAAAVGVSSTGESGVLFDQHRDDQAALYAKRGYRPMWSAEQDQSVYTKSLLTLSPASKSRRDDSE